MKRFLTITIAALGLSALGTAFAAGTPAPASGRCVCGCECCSESCCGGCGCCADGCPAGCCGN